MRMRGVRLLLASVALLSAAEPDLRIQKTATGIRFGMLGGKPARPAPTVFFLGGGVEDSLTQPQYLEAQRELGAAVLNVTIDLPGHGEDRRPSEPASLNAWCYRLDHGEDIVDTVVTRASAVLEFLIREGYTDASRVAAFGTSRGGFMALQWSAAEPRVRHVAAFAPVTDLLILREFFEMPAGERARSIAATTLAPRLLDRGIWLVIGSTDDRVSTSRTMEFAARLIEEARSRNQSPRVELHVQPSAGHRIPDGGYAEAARWLLRQWQMPGAR